MPTWTTIALFSLAGLALAVVPGPAVTYIVMQSVDKGRRAGVVSALGISGGGLVHVAARDGRAVGAHRVVGHGVHRREARRRRVPDHRRRASHPGPRRSEPAGEPDAAPLHRLFAQGVVVNVLNPKTALFFLAFLPQFVEKHRGPVALQVAFLGLLFVAIAASATAPTRCSPACSRAVCARSPRAARVRAWASGGIFVVLGITAAAAHRAADA